MARTVGRLNRDTVKKLKPGEAISERGIKAAKLANGDVRWTVNIMCDGERIHRTVGLESEGITRTQAENLIAKLRSDSMAGRLDLPKGRKLHLTFKEAAEQYLTRLEAGEGKNLPIKKRHLRKLLIPYFGARRIDRITDFNLKAYRKQRREAGVKDATINREMATISHLYRRAVEWKWITPDKPPLIEKTAEAPVEHIALTDEEAERLQRAALEDQDQRLWLFVAFGLGAAMRHREILAARYDQINFERRRLTIPKAKAGQRIQPLTPQLVAVLERQRKMEKDPDGWIFPTLIKKQSKAGHRTRMDRPFERAVKKAGLNPDEVTPHTMRRTAITRLVQAGVDLPTIQRISGHKTLAMVLRYAKLQESHIDAAMDKIAGFIPDTITQELHIGDEAANANRSGRAA